MDNQTNQDQPTQELSTETPQANTEPESTSNPQETTEQVAAPTEQPKHPGGAPEKYSNEELINKAEEYYQSCLKITEMGKVKIPYIQELAVLLDITRETLYERSEKCKELSYTMKKIMNLQQLRLLHRTLGKQPVGAIFQLKANHGMADRIDVTSDGEKMNMGLDFVSRDK